MRFCPSNVGCRGSVPAFKGQVYGQKTPIRGLDVRRYAKVTNSPTDTSSQNRKPTPIWMFTTSVLLVSLSKVTLLSWSMAMELTST